MEGAPKAEEEAVLNFAQYFQTRWKVGVKIYASDAKKSPPSELEVARYVKAMGVDQIIENSKKEAANV